MTDDSLGDTIGCSCLGKKLRVTGIIQHGIENGSFIDRAAHGQKTRKMSMLVKARRMLC